MINELEQDEHVGGMELPSQEQENLEECTSECRGSFLRSTPEHTKQWYAHKADHDACLTSAHKHFGKSDYESRVDKCGELKISCAMCIRHIPKSYRGRKSEAAKKIDFYAKWGKRLLLDDGIMGKIREQLKEQVTG